MTKHWTQALADALAETARITALNKIVQEATRLAREPGASTGYKVACNDIAKFAFAEMEKKP